MAVYTKYLTSRNDSDGIKFELTLQHIGPHGGVVHVCPGQVRTLRGGEHDAGPAHRHGQIQPAVEGHTVQPLTGGCGRPGQDRHWYTTR